MSDSPAPAETAGPSTTARIVAAYRRTFDRVETPYGDPTGDDALAADVGSGIDLSRDPDERMARHLRARTTAVDRVVVNAIDRGMTQVVSVGAGYDGRSLRYGAPRVRWFEVDRPATQHDKRERLSRLGIDTATVTFVGCDLTTDDLADALVRAGFDVDSPALFVCEGLIVYLAPAVVARLLEALRALAATGSRLALTSRLGGPARDPERRARFDRNVALMGEPARFGDADIVSLLTEAGWERVQLSERADRIGLVVARAAGPPDER